MVPRPPDRQGARRLIGRRAVVGGLAGALVFPHLILPARAAERVPTPAQTEGPFYPDVLPADTDADLVTVRGGAGGGPARGTVTHLFGRVRDPDGRPVPDALVEIWQCDAGGVYHHSRGGGGRDAGFQGYGRARARGGADYHFRTIRPVPYPGRTPHIHFKVQADGFQLTTQMYVAGEPGNGRDFLYRAIRDPRQRAAVTVALDPAGDLEAGALRGRFDIVLGG
ncbi:MAG: intradiol ring-cleavage dioxygenase [Hyphomicrobiales bacterium]|nr:intradiol ring-cleavage dioxygenase [Hyphomicrobiales bacterium]MCP5371879.1 intradiol ring-cleavage dioxygenase [Hyphomicrobiales bacterium]